MKLLRLNTGNGGVTILPPNIVKFFTINYRTGTGELYTSTADFSKCIGIEEGDNIATDTLQTVREVLELELKGELYDGF